MSATELRTASTVDVLGLRLLSLAGAAVEAAGGTTSVEEADAEADAASLLMQYVVYAPYLGNTMVQFFWSWVLVTAPAKVQSKLG